MHQTLSNDFLVLEKWGEFMEDFHFPNYIFFSNIICNQKNDLKCA